MNSAASPADEELLGRIRLGDRLAFADLMKHYEHEMYGYLRRYLGRDDLAADVFQNTFLAVFLKAGQHEPGRPVKPWLYAVATHAAIDAQRREKRQRLQNADPLVPEGDGKSVLDLAVSAGPGPLDSLDLNEQRVAVRNAVQELPETLRGVIVLAYFQGLRYQEIAEALNIPLGTVKSRMNTAVARLAAAMKKGGTQ